MEPGQALRQVGIMAASKLYISSKTSRTIH